MQFVGARSLKRSDVNYNILTHEVEAHLARPQYPLTSVGELAVIIQYGCSQRASEEQAGYPIVRMNNLQDDGLVLDDLKYVDLTQEELVNWRLEPGDVLFNRTNSKELVGKCEVFNERGDWVFASYLMRLRIDRARALPQFVSAFLSTRAGRAQIDQNSRQIIGMSNINAEELRTLRIPLPDTLRQAELLRVLNAAREDRLRTLEHARDLMRGLNEVVVGEIGLRLPLAGQLTSHAVRLHEVLKSRIDVAYHSPGIAKPYASWRRIACLRCRWAACHRNWQAARHLHEAETTFTRLKVFISFAL